MNTIFYWCVEFLKVLAKDLGMTYEEINVWIFCIIEPILFIVMAVIIYKQYKKIKTLKSS